jgi:hypothetical protein
MELKYANNILNTNNVFVDKCTVTGKYFWMVYDNGVFPKQRTGFDTVQEAFDNALGYFADG